MHDAPPPSTCRAVFVVVEIRQKYACFFSTKNVTTPIILLITPGKMETKFVTRMRPLGNIDVAQEVHDKSAGAGLTTFGAMKPTMSRIVRNSPDKEKMKFPAGFSNPSTDIRLQSGIPINVGSSFKFTACFAGSLEGSDDNDHNQQNIRGNPGATSMGAVTVFKILDRNRQEDGSMYHEQWQHTSLTGPKSEVGNPVRSNEHIHSNWVLDDPKKVCVDSSYRSPLSNISPSLLQTEDAHGHSAYVAYAEKVARNAKPTTRISPVTPSPYANNVRHVLTVYL